MDSNMKLLRAHIELDYDEESLRCHYYPTLPPESTLFEIDGQEYPATITIINKPNSYYFAIEINVCKNG
jgi:hypothetical protein